MTTGTFEPRDIVAERPLRDLTEEEIQQFERDGVVLVKGVFDEKWVSLVADAIDRMTSTPTPYGRLLSSEAHRMYTDLFMWKYDDAFRDFVFHSPAAHLASQALRSDRVNFMVDQMFKKEVGCKVPTQWHSDDIAWPVRGTRLLNIWLACDEATVENSSMQFIRGTHLLTVQRTAARRDASTDERVAEALAELGWKPSVVPRLTLQEPFEASEVMRAAFQHVHYRFEQEMVDAPLPDGLRGLISIEPNRDRLPVVGWDVEPGDAILFHPGILHFSTGNENGSNPRRALATRWLGNDTTYSPGAGDVPLLWQHGLKPGDPMGGPLFPQVLPHVVAEDVVDRFAGAQPGDPRIGYEDLKFRVDWESKKNS